MPQHSAITYWFLEHVFFFIQLGIIILIDELIFQMGGKKPPSSIGLQLERTGFAGDSAGSDGSPAGYYYDQ